MINEYLDIIFKLVVTVLIGGIIGRNRGVKNQVAGMRTHILVAIGACLSVLIPLHNQMGTYPNADPFRLSAQVISGIGFLGAGTIIQQGKLIKGLTTAASLWTVAIIGISIGTGEYFIGISSFLLVIFSLSIINKIGFISTDKYLEKTLIVKYIYSEENKQKLYETIKEEGISSKYENILKQEKVSGNIISYSSIEIRYIYKNVDLNKMIVKLMNLDFMKKAEYTLNIKT